MKKLNIAFQVIAILLAGFGPWRLAVAQNAPGASLADQLKAQYKLTKIGSDSSGLAIVEPGTVLVIRKGGILGVPPASLAIAPATYKDGDLHSPNAAAGNHTRLLSVGEKVYITKIDVNLKYDKVAVTIIECDSCNGAQKPSFYKSMVVFQFPKDYLTAAEVEQIEDVISQVLSQSSSADLTPPGNQSTASTQSLTNDDIIKLVQAKLPDSVVIAKIKSSSSEFDTSPDALIKLKRAGVSDSVLQAIVDARAQSNPSDSSENPLDATSREGPPADQPAQTPTSTPPAQMSFFVLHRHISLVGPGAEAVYYCSGTLSVSSEGAVSYDCSQTNDPSGRCDHVSFPTNSLKQVKVGFGGGVLHIASKTRGNFDFYGDRDHIQQAQALIAPLIQK
jgi:hypothetical protein